VEPLAAVVVLGLALAGGYIWWRAGGGARGRQRDPPPPKTVHNLEAGDVIAFWAGRNCIVDTVLDCVEEVGGRTVEWKWVILSDGQLLEIAADGNVIYGTTEILRQGSAPFEQLTGDHGVLKVFEQRVRESVAGSQAVHFLHDGTNYQAKSTGTFRARSLGRALTAEVLRDIGSEARENVYFEMESASGAVALGIWTTHIAWYAGQPLQDSDIVDIYPRGKEARDS